VTDALQLAGLTNGCNTPPSAFLAQLHAIRVGYVIVGPTAYLPTISSYFTTLTGHSPISDQGVLIWSV
jgi:hypothetical protein